MRERERRRRSGENSSREKCSVEDKCAAILKDGIRATVLSANSEAQEGQLNRIEENSPAMCSQ